MSDEQTNVKPAKPPRERVCSVCGQPLDHTWKTIWRCKAHHYEYLKQYRQTAQGKKLLAEKQAKYRKANADKVNAYNAEWMKAHPEVNRRNVAASRARKRSGGEGSES